MLEAYFDENGIDNHQDMPFSLFRPVLGR